MAKHEWPHPSGYGKFVAQDDPPALFVVDPHGGIRHIAEPDLALEVLRLTQVANEASAANHRQKIRELEAQHRHEIHQAESDARRGAVVTVQRLIGLLLSAFPANDAEGLQKKIDWMVYDLAQLAGVTLEEVRKTMIPYLPKEKSNG